MKRILVVLGTSLLLAGPASASLSEIFGLERMKEDWEYKPVAVVIAVPLIVVTSPFMIAKWAMERAEEDAP